MYKLFREKLKKTEDDLSQLLQRKYFRNAISIVSLVENTLNM